MFGRSARERTETLLVVGTLALAAIVLLLLLPATRLRLLEAWVRLSGISLDIGGYRIEAEAPDRVRQQINGLFEELMPSSGPLGIGYGNFGVFYAERYPFEGIANMTLHSMYQVWQLEIGWVGATASVLMCATFFVQCWHAWRLSETTERQYFIALAISMIAVMAAGLFHQMHQLPMMFVLLGLAAGGSKQCVCRNVAQLRKRAGLGCSNTRLPSGQH